MTDLLNDPKLGEAFHVLRVNIIRGDEGSTQYHTDKQRVVSAIVSALEAALRKYGRCPSDCASNDADPEPCDCGLDTLLGRTA